MGVCPPETRGGARMKTMLGHLAIILSGMYLVLFAIDRVNRAMFFIDNNITKWLLVILSLVTIVNAILLLAQQRKQCAKKYKEKKHNRDN